MSLFWRETARDFVVHVGQERLCVYAHTFVYLYVRVSVNLCLRAACTSGFHAGSRDMCHITIFNLINQEIRAKCVLGWNTLCHCGGRRKQCHGTLAVALPYQSTQKEITSQTD